MSPAKIKILLHYYVTSNPCTASDIGVGAEFLDSAKLELEKDSLLEPVLDPTDIDYVLTARGDAYIKGLINLPLPYEDSKWVFVVDDIPVFRQ